MSSADGDRKRPFDENDTNPEISAADVPSLMSFAPSSTPNNAMLLAASNRRDSPKPLAVVTSNFSPTLARGRDAASGTSRSALQDVVNLCDDYEDQDFHKVNNSHTSRISVKDEDIEVVKTVKSKRVTFSEIEHEVKYFKRYPVEEALNNLKTINENGEDYGHSHNPASSENSRATADITILSSRHGRARRQLRNITKRDLQTAIKYGIMVPAHPDRATGRPRWKFLYNGIVYITDETTRKEITSYQEAVQIDLIEITDEMMEHHIEVKRIIREESHLCTGHTMICIDQSGSMRNSDVNGFVSRSHAAYGTLALDFISEQLNLRPNHEDLYAESVTVVEMRDKGEKFFQKEPLDWILFNRMCQRPNVSRPSYHGNYNESLSMIVTMIQEEYDKLLEDGVEHKDMPTFSIVFMSDGRPSDCKPDDTERRSEILKTLAQSLQSKLLLYAMGVGANGSDFGALASMVKTVKEYGGEGQFVHAGLSAFAMSSTFSDISQTLTSHRTTLLSQMTSPKDGNEVPVENATSKTKKDFTMRETGKIVGKKMPSEIYLQGKDYTIKRFRFEKLDTQKFRWKDVGFANHGAIGFEVEDHPFGKGSERLAYRFRELKPDKKSKAHRKAGKTMVAKGSIHVEKESKEAFHENFCRVQSVAQELAEKFNDAIRKAESLQSVVENIRPPELQFMLCHVYTYKNNNTKEEKALLVEKKLAGKFTKYNSNNGYVKAIKEGHSIELKCGKVPFEEFVQSFSHWVYVHSNRNLIVCDIQGVLNEEGRNPIFQLTDPAICTRKGPRYGNTDMKINGIRNFCRTHKCGLVCEGLGLQCIRTMWTESKRRRIS